VILTAAGETYLREVNGGNGYSGQSTFRLHFGIGKTQRVDAVEIRWPSGLVEKLSKDHVKKLTNKVSTVQEGKGIIR
jgi:enediyne biosynthesis protein E4